MSAQVSAPSAHPVLIMARCRVMTDDMGARIRAARALRGWSQSELAKRLGVHRGTVAAWESGTIPATRQNDIARVLDLDLTVIQEPTQQTDGHWTMVVQPDGSPLGQLRAIRRELTRLADRLDGVILELETQQPPTSV